MQTPKVFKVLTLVNFLLIAGLLLYLFLSSLTPKRKTFVYVNNVQLFNQFNMAKDLGKLHQDKLKAKEKELDSLFTVYNVLKTSNNTNKIKSLEASLSNGDSELQQMKQYFSSEVSQQVWNRLNGYLKTYGEDNNYEIIFGSKGDGTVMYAKEGNDITDAVVSYVNEKYEGN